MFTLLPSAAKTPVQPANPPERATLAAARKSRRPDPADKDAVVSLDITESKPQSR